MPIIPKDEVESKALAIHNQFRKELIVPHRTYFNGPPDDLRKALKKLGWIIEMTWIKGYLFDITISEKEMIRLKRLKKGIEMI